MSDPNFEKCVKALKESKNDTEKMAGLFLVTKTIKAEKLSTENRKALFDAISFKFLLRLLHNPSTPDCPASLYKSLALSILTTFSMDKAIAESKEMCTEVLPFLLNLILNEADTDEDSDALNREAYQCLVGISSFEKGALILADSKTLPKIVELYTEKDVDEVLDVLKTGTSTIGWKFWSSCPKEFETLLNRVSLMFEVEQGEHKFHLLEVMNPLVQYYDKKSVKEDEALSFWPSSIRTGLIEILSSKLNEKQRNPALKLASLMISTFGIDWLIKSSSEDSETESNKAKNYQFLVLLLNLCCIEVRMGLEDQPLAKIFERDELLGSCYIIIEEGILLMKSSHFENLDEKQKEQIFSALKGGSNAILSFLNLLQKEEASSSKKKVQGTPFWTARRKTFTIGSIKCLAVWAAEEVSTLREEIYRILPFILKLAVEEYEDVEMELSTDELTLMESGKSITPFLPSLFTLLLPSLCLVTALEEGANIMLELHLDVVLFKFLETNSKIYQNLTETIQKQTKGKKKNVGEKMNVELLQENHIKARSGMIHVTNIFLNLSVHSAGLVRNSQVFQSVMRWTFNTLPTLTSEEELPLIANIVALGLLLLLHSTKKHKESKMSKEEEFQASLLMDGSDRGAFRFGQGVIRFLWDGHVVNEMESPPTLEVNSTYRPYWLEMSQIWFLSLATTGTLMAELEWIGNFAAESGFLDAILKHISKAYKNAIDSQTLTAYEEFFVAVLNGKSNDASEIIKTKGLALANSHHLRILRKGIDAFNKKS